jgi:hypothetical protein
MIREVFNAKPIAAAEIAPLRRGRAPFSSVHPQPGNAAALAALSRAGEGEDPY